MHEKWPIMADKQNNPTLASQADKYSLYQKSVQAPEAEVRFFQRAFKQAYGRLPAVLREDFCGTAAVSCEWVRSRSQRIAHGFDIDPAPLDWGLRNNVSSLERAQRARLHLHQRDVREVKGPKADIVAAQNFSYFAFRTRDELRHYFESARRNLAKEGLLVLDIMGGSEVIEEDRKDVRKFKRFKYIWEHRRFDPVTNYCEYAIHFKFKDGSRLRRAFLYQWRLWSIAEVRELLAEAGFSASEVFWEGTEVDTDEGNGVYRRCTSAPSDPAWVSYVVGIK